MRRGGISAELLLGGQLVQFDNDGEPKDKA